MKKAAGLVDLLVVIVLVIILYFTCFNGSKEKNPFEQQMQVNEQKTKIESKINEIEKQKAIKERIENNLNREEY